MRYVILLSLFVTINTAYAEVYRCQLADKQVLYQSLPCSGNSADKNIVNIEKLSPEQQQAAEEQLKAIKAERQALDKAALEQQKSDAEQQQLQSLQREIAAARQEAALARQQTNSYPSGIRYSYPSYAQPHYYYHPLMNVAPQNTLQTFNPMFSPAPSAVPSYTPQPFPQPQSHFSIHH